MLKRSLSVLLAILMLASIFTMSCNPVNPPETSGGENAETPNETPNETPGETPGETDPVTPPDNVDDPTADGTLWYYEDFEDYELTNDSSRTAALLGWTYNESTDVLLATNTAEYRIADYNGSRQFYIKNYISGKSAKDSFIVFLDKQLRYLHNTSYTYQYDLTYTEATNNSRYIVLVSEYKNDGGFYNSGHIRIGGYGNNECYAGSWKQYDTKIDKNRDVGSVSDKLLGKTGNNTNVFENVSISIRYVVDWENGNKIYGRVNDKNSYSKGEWVLLSEFDPTQSGKDFWDPAAGGYALAFKTGGQVNGYIDNITVWAGTGEEPADKSNPYLTSKTACHKMAEIEGKVICTLCGKDEEAIAKNWLMSDVPKYDGGAVSEELYLAGQGMDEKQPLDKEARMHVISGTNAEQFNAYLKKLTDNGYTAEYSRDADGNLFRSFLKGNQRIYTYYLDNAKEVRVIAEDATIISSLEDIGYTYTKKAGDTTSVFMYSLAMRDGSHFSRDGYVDNGMLLIIKLADNSVMIIDGGAASQFPEEQVDNLMSVLREITGAGENGKVKIAAWYNTHGHGDHYQGFGLLIQKYHDYLSLERIIANIPSLNSPNSTVRGNNGGIMKMFGYIKQYFGEVDIIRPHTGQIIQLADVKIEIMYTHEDLVDATTGETKLDNNYNEASMVSKIHFDGKTFMCTGDIDNKAASTILKNWKAESLKVDVLQVAHHVLNDLSAFYHTVQAPILLVPQSLHRIQEHRTAPKTYQAVIPYVKNDMCYFQNENTVGLTVVDGEIKLTYSKPVIYKIKDTKW